MKYPDHCPIENTLRFIGKKWTIEILRDCFFGKTRFNEILSRNPDLSTKMLSTRLKEMVAMGILDKQISNDTPVVIEYKLTSKGKSLGPILHELAVYSLKNCCEDIYDEPVRSTKPLICTSEDMFCKCKGSR